MKNRRFAFQNKLFLIFVFSLTFTLGFLGFKSVKEIFAVNSAYAGFSAGNIMSDYIMSDYTSMSESSIQNFLKSHNSCGAKVGTWRSQVGQIVTYYRETKDPTTWHATSTANDGTFVCLANENINGESAAHIIYQAAQDYYINPKVLIVLLEKEQSLITDTIPHSVQYRSATGYGCPDHSACDSQYYGFKNQVRNAARMFRLILDNGSSYYPVGYDYVKYNKDEGCGGSTVYIENRATSALYQYTPYQPNNSVLNTRPGTSVGCGAYGNANFYYYYRMWFGDTHTTLSTVNLPSETFEIKTTSGKYIIPESNASGANLVLSSNATASNRQYTLTKSGDYYIITHVASGLVLDLTSANTDNGTKIQLYAEDGTLAQKWRLSISGNDYTLHSALADGKVIDVPGGASTDGLSLQIYDANGTSAQNFTFSDISEAPISEGSYFFETTAGTQLMSVGGTGNGTSVTTAGPTYSNYQKFTITRANDGLYTIKNVASGRVLDVAAGSSTNGASVQLYDSNNSCAQRWIVEKSGEGYRFLSSCSGKAIDIPGGATSTSGMMLQIYSANGSNAQVWVPRTNVVEQSLSDGEYIINSALGNNLVIDIAGGAENSRNGTNINSYTANGTSAQKFKVTYNKSTNAYSIINEKSGRALDVAGGSTRNGANVQVYSSNGSCAQLWRLRKSGDAYNLISVCSDKVLDIAGGSTRNGANIQIYEYNNSNAQRWIFTPTN